MARGVFGAKRQDAAAQAGGQPDAPVAKPDAPVTKPKDDAAAAELKKVKQASNTSYRISRT